jgi:hypothetical protein
MKLGLVFAIAALGASAASAAEPASVIGYWKPDKLPGTVGLTMLQFTADGRVFSMPEISSVQWIIPGARPGGAPPRYLPRLPQELIGRYETQGDKVVVRLDPRLTSTFELTQDGRLCVYPGPALMNGEVRRQSGARQCYQRLGAERS